MSKDNIPEDIKKIIKQLETCFKKNENRKKIEDLLNNFASLEREQLLCRLSSFARHIEDICGSNTANLLMQGLSLSLPELDGFLAAFKDDEIRNWLRDLNFRHITSFEGIFPPFPNDWYRVLWNVKFSTTHGNMFFLELTILKRNGKIVDLEMPFPTSVKLVNYILQRISETKEKIEPELKSILSEELEKTKGFIDSIVHD